MSLKSPALVGGFFTTSAPWEALFNLQTFGNYLPSLAPIPATTYVHTVIKYQEKSEISNLRLSWRLRPLPRPSSGSMRLRAPRTL